MDGKVSAQIQAEMFADVIRLVTRSTRWLLQNRWHGLDPDNCVGRYQEPLAEVLASRERLATVIPESRWQERYEEYHKEKVPEPLAAYCASAESRYWLMDMIEISRQLDQDLESVAWVYFRLGESLNLTWLDRQMRTFRARGHWQVLATIHYRDELDQKLRDLTSSVLSAESEDGPGERSPEQLLEVWREDKQSLLGRWKRMLGDMQAANEVDCAVFSVAHGVLRELASKA